MKKIILGLSLIFGAMLLFSSCEREVHTLYTYKVDVTNVSEDGKFATVTQNYLEVELEWNDAETIDNEAATRDKAAKKNDEEAIREFNAEVVKYNESSLYGRYASKGVQRAQGTFTYRLTRVDDNTVLAEKDFAVDYSNTPLN